MNREVCGQEGLENPYSRHFSRCRFHPFCFCHSNSVANCFSWRKAWSVWIAFWILLSVSCKQYCYYICCITAECKNKRKKQAFLDFGSVLQTRLCLTVNAWHKLVSPPTTHTNNFHKICGICLWATKVQPRHNRQNKGRVIALIGECMFYHVHMIKQACWNYRPLCCRFLDGRLPGNSCMLTYISIKNLQS